MKCEMNTMPAPLSRSRRTPRTGVLSRRREGRGGFVEDDDAGAREQDAGDLDELLQADRQVAERGTRIDVDAEPGQLFARLARHAPHCTCRSGWSAACRETGSRRPTDRARPQLLVDHGDPPRALAGRSKSGLPAVEQKRAGEFRDAAGDDLHQRALAGPVLADETMDLAGGEREIDVAQRLDAAEGLGTPESSRRASDLAA